jgi:hypothetical protein
VEPEELMKKKIDLNPETHVYDPTLKPYELVGVDIEDHCHLKDPQSKEWVKKWREFERKNPEIAALYDKVRKNCGSCSFFMPEITVYEMPKAGETIPEEPDGRCRRHAPTVDGYPGTDIGNWCGDYKRKKKRRGCSKKNIITYLKRRLERAHYVNTQEEGGVDHG